MKFEEIVEQVVADYKDKPVEERNKIVEEVCERYVAIYDKKPDMYLLTKLADLILHDDLTNPNVYKVQQEEYSFHSDTQRRRRNRKEFTAISDTLDHMKFKKTVNLSTAPPKDIMK